MVREVFMYSLQRPGAFFGIGSWVMDYLGLTPKTRGWKSILVLPAMPGGSRFIPVFGQGRPFWIITFPS
jgi:hypothetical protein